MATGTRTDRNDPVNALLSRLARMAHADHVMEDQPAVRVHCIDDLPWRAQAGDDQRNLVAHTGLHVVGQPVVAHVCDLVHREWRHLRARIRRRIGSEFIADPREPLVERRGGPCIQRGKRADYTGLALLDHELGRGRNEHRRADDRKAQATTKCCRNRHQSLPIQPKQKTGRDGAAPGMALRAGFRRGAALFTPPVIPRRPRHGTTHCARRVHAATWTA